MILLSFLAIENLDPVMYENLSSIALRFGPFFFSLFFAIFFIPWAQRKYRKIAEQQNPKPSERQRKIYAWYFIGSGIFCASLIIVCIFWWISIQGSLKIISGEIQDVGDYIDISSPDLYFRTVKYENTSSKTFHFVYKYSTEIKPDSFKLYITKAGRAEESSTYIKCADVSGKLLFKYEYDVVSEEHKVISLAQNKSQRSLSLLNTAYANNSMLLHSKTVIMNYLENNISYNPRYIQEIQINLDYISRLQDESTAVGSKIMIIDELLSIQSNSEILTYLKYVSNKEPFIITLLDLSRHSDSELAYKTSKLLDPYPIEDILYEILSNESDDQSTQNEMMSRLPAYTAQRIFELNTDNERIEWINEYKREIEAGDTRQKPLFPTGSRKGDRYYVKATWDKNDPETSDCLCELFNRELIADRTFEEEMDLMQQKGGVRYVYWYSKDWALYIAKEIEACGANAEFVGL